MVSERCPVTGVIYGYINAVLVYLDEEIVVASRYAFAKAVFGPGHLLEKKAQILSGARYDTRSPVVRLMSGGLKKQDSQNMSLPKVGYLPLY